MVGSWPLSMRDSITLDNLYVAGAMPRGRRITVFNRQLLSFTHILYCTESVQLELLSTRKSVCQHVVQLYMSWQVDMCCHFNNCILYRCYSCCRKGNLCVNMSFIPKCHDMWCQHVIDKSSGCSWNPMVSWDIKNGWSTGPTGNWQVTNVGHVANFTQFSCVRALPWSSDIVGKKGNQTKLCH